MCSAKRNALGRGLSALLEDHQPLEGHGQGRSLGDHPPIKSDGSEVQGIFIDQVEANPYQPRGEFGAQALEELAGSIRLHGIIQPITVRKLDSGHYQLISGERRLRASKMAGLSKIPAYVRLAADQGMHEMALIENIQRENLNALEIAFGLQRMLEECALKQEELGERVSKSRSTVTNYLRLLKLPDPIQSGIKENKISMGHAKVLLGVEHIDHQLYLFHEIIRQELSVRKTEQLAKALITPSKPKKSSPTASGREYLKIQDRLSSHFGTRVRVRLTGENDGKIEIPFLSTPDLNRILELLNEHGHQ